MAWVYVLRCSDDSLYVGSTRDLDTRVAEHAAGCADGFTSSRRPVELVFAQEFDRVDEAWSMERRIKGWRRAKKLALIEGRFPDLPALSRNRSREPDAT